MWRKHNVISEVIEKHELWEPVVDNSLLCTVTLLQSENYNHDDLLVEAEKRAVDGRPLLVRA